MKKERLQFLVMLMMSASISLAQNTFSIIQQPQHIIKSEGTVNFDKINIKTDQLILKKYLNQEFKNHHLAKSSNKKGNTITFEIDSKISNKEGYRMVINREGIRISAKENAGFFYGAQSLLQLMRENSESQKLPFCEI